MPKVKPLYTPVGIVKFPKTTIEDKEVNFLMVPKDFPEDGRGSWKFLLSFDPKTDDGKAILTELSDQAGEIKGANFKPYKADKEKKDPEDPDCKEYVENGRIAINFTSGFPIKFIDSVKREIKDIKVGWGSKVRVKFTTKPVNNNGKVGLGRYVQVVQVLDLKTVGEDLSGFDEVEDGYKSPAQSIDDIGWEE